MTADTPTPRLGAAILSPWAALVAVILFAPVATAHEFWLSPSTYGARPGDTVTLSAYVGTGFRGELKPYAAPRTITFLLRGPRELDLRPAALNGDVAYARFRPADAGGALLAYQSNFAFIELPAMDFDRYLKLEGLDEPLAARAKRGTAAGPGRERYARCAKTWLAGSDSSRALSPVGFPLEIVPLSAPGSSGQLGVRVLWQGKPLAGALVRTWNSPLGDGLAPRDAAVRDSVGPASEARTGRDGVVKLRLSQPGEWLVNAVHMVPSSDPQAADWESYWASLTFAREPKP